MAQHTDLFNAAKEGNHGEVARLLTVLAPKDIEHSGALREAAAQGHTQCVALLTASHVPVGDFAALNWAAQNGHLECVKLLVSRLDAKEDDSYALYCAVRGGHSDIVNFLLPISDPKACQSSALSRAAAGGKAECLSLLIPYSEPKQRNSRALRQAVLNGHTQCVEILYPVSDPNVVLDDLEDFIEPSGVDIKFYQAYTVLVSMMEKEHLEQSLNGVWTPAVRKL